MHPLNIHAQKKWKTKDAVAKSCVRRENNSSNRQHTHTNLSGRRAASVWKTGKELMVFVLLHHSPIANMHAAFDIYGKA